MILRLKPDSKAEKKVKKQQKKTMLKLETALKEYDFEIPELLKEFLRNNLFSVKQWQEDFDYFYI